VIEIRCDSATINARLNIEKNAQHLIIKRSEAEMGYQSKNQALRNGIGSNLQNRMGQAGPAEQLRP
jgi:hypothetical protein